jgi:hypothetical protein
MLRAWLLCVKRRYDDHEFTILDGNQGDHHEWNTRRLPRELAIDSCAALTGLELQSEGSAPLRS